MQPTSVAGAQATTSPAATSAPGASATAIPAATRAAVTATPQRATGATPAAASWDRETDIVVLGTGTACVAALVAKNAGADVVVLEKAGFIGGTTGVSGGTLWIPNNYLERQANIADSKEEALTYLRQVTRGQSSDELMNAFLDNAPPMIEWLRDRAGFQWQPGGWSMTDPAMSVFCDYFAEFPGGKTRGRNVVPVPQGNLGNGGALIAYAQRAFDAAGIQPLLNTPGKQLITNTAGEVIGVVAETEGREIRIKARKAVIIGVGGFDHNKDMRTQFLRLPIYHSCSVSANTGDGHHMAMAVGADLSNMNNVYGFPAYDGDPETLQGIEDWGLWRGKPGTIIVNKRGQRIGNESSPYADLQRAFGAWETNAFDWLNIPAFIIVDSGYASRYPMVGTFQPNSVPEFITRADTLDAPDRRSSALTRKGSARPSPGSMSMPGMA